MSYTKTMKHLGKKMEDGILNMGWIHSIFYIPFSIFRTSVRGIATLPTVMLLGIITLTVAISLATVSFSESFISQSGAQSSKALFYAEAGARDALVRIARNKNYTCASSDCYEIPFTTNGCEISFPGCAKVSVSAGVGTLGDPKIITSKGLMQASVRTINVSVTLDADANGEIATTTWSESTN
jgi:hypothetical protein